MQFICPYCRGVVAVDDGDHGQDVQCGHCGEIVTAPLSRVATNAVIGDFIILEEIGRGGMGVVYFAHQISLDRPAALKVLAEQYARNSEFVVGFIKEARAAAKLNHPHIVQAYAVGEDNGIYYFAMENIDGETMKTVLKREGRIPTDQALTVIQQIAEALDYAWKEQRLIHRDIKPDNIMLTRTGRAKLADLGLARVAGEIDDTGGDEVMGTPQYISPEHLTGSEMDVRSDIYSLGATLFHLITGRFAYEGRNASEIARKHIEAPVPNPRSVDPTIPSDVAYVVMKMMAKDPDERYQTAEELVEDLRQVRRGKGLAIKGKPTGGGGGGGKQFTVKKVVPPAATGTQHGKTLRIGGASPRATGSFPVAATTSAVNLKTTNTGSGLSITPTESVRRKKEQTAMRQIVIWLAVCFAMLVAVGAFIVWKVMPGDSKDPGKAPARPGPPQVAPVQPTPPKPPPEPEKTPYTEAIRELLAFAREHPGKRDDLLIKADRFFRDHPQPRYRSEERALADLLAAYVPADESIRVARNRARARERHLAVLRQREQEAAGKLAAEEQEKRRQELEEQRQRLLAEQQERERQWVDKYRSDLQSRRDFMRERYAHFGTLRQFARAREAFSGILDEPDKVPEQLKGDARELADWGRRMQGQVDKAERLWSSLSNAGAAITLQIEAVTGEGAARRRHFGPISRIADGQVSIRAGGGETVTVPLPSLAIRQLKRLLREAADNLLREPDAAFHYLMATGEYPDALDMVPDAAWGQELSATALAYFNGRFKILAGMPEEQRRRELSSLSQKYRSMPEWEQARRAANP